MTHRKQIINIADNVVEIAERKVFQEKDDFLKYFEEKNKGKMENKDALDKQK